MQPSEVVLRTRMLPALLVAGTVSCISTGRILATHDALCRAQATSPAPYSSVLMVTTDLHNAGLIRCSGVAIAPTLVVTDLLCVRLLPELDPSDSDAPPEEETLAGMRNLLYVDVDYERDCRMADRWSLVEDGGFSARL